MAAGYNLFDVTDDEYGNEHNVVTKYAQKFNFTLNIYPNDSLSYTYGNIYSNWTGYGILNGLIIEDDEYTDLIYGGSIFFPHVDNLRSVRYTYEVSVPLPK